MTEKRISIGVDEVTNERLAKLEKITGIGKREHLRRAVQRYFDAAPELFTAPVVEALAQLPTDPKERARLGAPPAAPDSSPRLRRK
jgi:hypothetical protein